MEKEDDLLVMPLCADCAAKVPDHSISDQSSWVDKPSTYQIV
jgi:hypothetical protein